jgi:hypothetical protein
VNKLRFKLSVMPGDFRELFLKEESREERVKGEKYND